MEEVYRQGIKRVWKDQNNKASIQSFRHRAKDVFFSKRGLKLRKRIAKRQLEKVSIFNFTK